MGLQLRQTFEAAILTQLHPRSQIDIYVQVLQADGGTYAACVNAATLAVLDAGIPMRDFVCACCRPQARSHCLRWMPGCMRTTWSRC
uniref:Exosome component 4 n=1 Tax=Molossus molossus TaxID=27622 RepID=A0A7J8BAQ5_MOLMO|nr:exosome component 4 [Molossus molossus]